ncbi:alcohol dehydrogenase GroES-like domain-containing protein [Dactylonectria macrodidyma]|uniref:Alcohol dehydrogenase GroES-like domain-containing protein n=1 Tax=Dactylonectria macrodidyma TaxID=307937 RepID=A0A9P9FHE3_9HYPO|nr:alcohol dehydrogenase GroES-like domain-containing protein [Dactylonectria macrodidyma]
MASTTVLPTSYKAAVIEAAGAPLRSSKLIQRSQGPPKSSLRPLLVACAIPILAFSRVISGHTSSRASRATKLLATLQLERELVMFPIVTAIECHIGLFQICDNAVSIVIYQDSCYAESILLRSEAIVRVPKDLDTAEVSPLLCASITAFNSIRKMQIEQGNLIAIQGIGRLGHLAIQYANKMGYRVAAGKFCVLARVGRVKINSFYLIFKAASVYSWPSGYDLDYEDVIDFARTYGIECLVERFSLK